jgi:opacity protein-like surface antigen
MKRFIFVAVLVMALLAVGAIAAFAAPGGPAGFGRTGGMMGQGGFGHMGGMMGGQGGYDMMGGGRMMGDDFEALLGIDHANIHAAHVAGKSLVDIAAEKGFAEDQLIKALLDGRKAALAQAVKTAS